MKKKLNSWIAEIKLKKDELCEERKIKLFNSKIFRSVLVDETGDNTLQDSGGSNEKYT